MNWDIAGAISEIVGAIGIIVTLAYLALQVRQNSTHLAESAKLTEANQIEATANAVIEQRNMLLLNPELMDLQTRGSQDYLSLDSRERPKFDLLMRNGFQLSQAMYLRHVLFNHDPENHSGATKRLDQALRMPGIREWLSHNEVDWRPEFRDWVESAIKRIDRENDLELKADQEEQGNSQRRSNGGT